MPTVHISSVTTADELKCGSAKWILRVGETRALTRTAINGIVQDASDLVSGIAEELKQQVFDVISANGIANNCEWSHQCI